MIRRLSYKEIDDIGEIINRAASAYKNVIPGDCYRDPYMPVEELRNEMQSMTFFGWQDKGKLTGVMGFQPVGDVTLIRHAYVLPEYQRKGIGTKLLENMKKLTKTTYLLVGTWADTNWALKFYQKHGFKFSTDKDELLRRYWDIPEKQIAASVVLYIKV